MNKVLFVTLIALLSFSCEKNTVKIQGSFSGVDKSRITLEKITTNDITTIDTAVTDNKGRFDFKFKLADKNPSFYNLRYKDHVIPLLVSPGERINVRSLGNISRNYIVEGSRDSELVKDVNAMVTSSSISLDSLYRIYFMTTESEAAYDVIKEHSKIYIQNKQDLIRFIVDNPTSLAAVYALYQQLASGQRIFDFKSDILYFKMVSDSLSSRYPGSPHVISLQKDIKNAEEIIEADARLIGNEVSFPDITLPDSEGKLKSLSSTAAGKVILLDFWLSSNAGAKLNNAEMKEIYKELHSRGLEIYQVSLDNSKLAWITSVHEQQLPWINVWDENGSGSLSARLYNVTSLPSNYLIDKNGDIVARNIFGEQLKNKVKELL